MNILAFDTCFGSCSVAARKDVGGGRFRAAATFDEAESGSQAERLMALISEAMAAVELSFGEVDRIAVTVGPGSFTGVRVGVAAARAFGLATGKDVVGVSSLLALGWQTLESLGASIAPRQLAVCVDARKDQIFVQLVDTSRAPRSEPLLLTAGDAARRFGGVPVAAVGSGAEAFSAAARAIGQDVEVVPSRFRANVAGAMIDMAERVPVLDTPVRPLYLRQADTRPQEGKTIARKIV